MKRSVLVFALFLTLSLGSLGCNTAQISQPAPLDAGPPCSAIAPIVTCDAGGVVQGGCAGKASLVLDAPDASSTVPAGAYPVGCTVAFFYQDRGSGQCNRAPACTCLAPDAGFDEAGAENEAGAPALPGVWSCFPTE